MAKNKGGREIRKPKQVKQPKVAEPAVSVTATERKRGKGSPAK